MANEAEQAIAVRLANAPTFHPVTADLFVDDWGLDAGDVVTVRSGETDYSVPIYNMSLDWRGSAMAQIQSTGNKERKPLSALKRKQFASGRAGYRAEQKVDEQGVIYDGKFVVTNKHVTSVLSATGVKLDANGNPVTVYNPVTEQYEYVFDEHGANLASKITQNAGAISTEVSTRTAQGASFNSRITQTANSISQIVQAVGQNGEVTAASIALSINAEGSNAVIAADHIELDGDTVASVLYGRQVEVDEINAEIADFTEMDVEERLSVMGNFSVVGDATFTSITLDGTFSSVVTDFSISGSALTLYRSDGTSETFRKATSLRGDWSGLTYTVTAQPENVGVEPLPISLGVKTVKHYPVDGSVDIKLVEIDPDNPLAEVERFTREVYLQANDDYCYITNTSASPSTSNIVAQIPNPKVSEQGGIYTLTLTSGDSSDYSDWDVEDKGFINANGYYLVSATPYSGTGKYFKFKTPAGSSGYDTGYIAGWGMAYNQLVLPGATTLDNHNVLTLKYPGQSVDTWGVNYYYLTCDNAYAYVRDANSTTGGSAYAKIPNPAYPAGWAMAYAQVGLPQPMTIQQNNIVTVYTPTQNVDGGRVPTNLYLVCDDTYVYIRSEDGTASGNTYARIPNTAYASGQMSVTLTGGTWDWDSGNEIMYANVEASSPNTHSKTVYLPTITMSQSGSTMRVYAADNGGTRHQIASRTVSDPYDASVTLTYRGLVNGVYTYTTSTYVSGLNIGTRYTVHFNK